MKRLLKAIYLKNKSKNKLKEKQQSKSIINLKENINNLRELISDKVKENISLKIEIREKDKQLKELENRLVQMDDMLNKIILKRNDNLNRRF